MAAKFLIEVPHEGTKEACARAIAVFYQTGSHFFTRADWGCKDGEHKAWIIVEVDSKVDARALLPPSLRAQAKIVQLNTFSPAEVEEILSKHGS